MCCAVYVVICFAQGIRHLEAHRHHLQLPVYVAHGTKDAVTDINVSAHTQCTECNDRNTPHSMLHHATAGLSLGRTSRSHTPAADGAKSQLHVCRRMTRIHVASPNHGCLC